MLIYILGSSIDSACHCDEISRAFLLFAVPVFLIDDSRRRRRDGWRFRKACSALDPFGNHNFPSSQELYCLGAGLNMANGTYRFYNILYI